MPNSNPINSKHGPIRAVLRIVGPILIVIGGLCVITAAVDFFSAFGDFGRQPTKFYLFFVGLPIGFVGLAMTQAGFLGAILRYQAGEAAPVEKDTFNYLARETRRGVKDIASAIGEGLRDEPNSSGAACPDCGNLNDSDARFCDRCGAALPSIQHCAKCGVTNDPDARFCDGCGDSLR